MNKIISGLEDAVAYVAGDGSRARVHLMRVFGGQSMMDPTLREHLTPPASRGQTERDRAIHRARAILRRTERDAGDGEDVNLARQFLRAIGVAE